MTNEEEYECDNNDRNLYDNNSGKNDDINDSRNNDSI